MKKTRETRSERLHTMVRPATKEAFERMCIAKDITMSRMLSDWIEKQVAKQQLYHGE